MNAFVRVVIGVVAATACVPLAAAPRDGSATLVLTANVAPFCQVSQASSEVDLVNGEASFGPVREMCNTGYRVLASFVNLDQATVVTAQGSEALADDGTVAFERPMASKISQAWNVRDAVKHDPAAPVIVQVNVTPL